MLATEYARLFGIERQQDGESDMAFRHRVAGRLQEMGKIILAHEAQADERIEVSEDVFGQRRRRNRSSNAGHG